MIGTATVASSLYGGTSRLVNTTSADYAVGGTQIGTAQTSADYTWTTGASDNYTYFCLKRGASAQYFSSIVITYELPPLTVTFDSQGGSSVSNGTTTVGGTVADPGNPTRSGFTFNGWFTASSGGSAITFPYTHGQTADFTLFAQWTASGSCTAPTVSNTSATSVGATVTTLNAEVTGLGSTATAITARGFEYATNSSLTTPNVSIGSGSFVAEPFSRNLTGLNPNTQYWYRGFATNDCATPLTGYTHTSGFPSFTTQHNAPTVQPESNITSGGFTANWAVDNSNSPGSVVFTYQLDYSTTSNFTPGTFTSVSSIPSNTTSYNVTGLSAGTPYWYRVRINNGQSSVFSATEPVVTLNTITTGAVSTSPYCVSATGTASGTVAFTSVGTFTGNTYQVELSNASGTFSGNMIGSLVSDANSGTINVTIPANTPSGTGYRMRVVSNSPATTGAQSAAFTVNLGPANVTAQSATVGNQQVRVNWTNPTTCYDDIMVVAKPTSTPFTAAVPSGTAYTHNSNSFTDPLNSTFDGGKVVYRGSTPNQWITGLTNGTNYTFKVFSRKNNDWSAGVTTTGTPVPPSVNLTINSTTGTEAATSQVILTITAASAVIGDQSVSVGISGTGITNGDFTGVTFPTTITILSGQTTGSITFNVADDNASEGDETATFTISSPTSGITIGTATRTLTITDNPLTYINLTALNVAHTESFDGMGAVAGATPTGFAIQDGNTATLAGTVTQQASTGSPSAGGSYNWGQSASERALGLMFSGSYSSKSVLAAVRNNTGSTGTVFEISFDYEQYRQNTASQTFKLQYSTSLTTGWVDVANAGFTSMVSGTSTYGFSPLVASQGITALQFTPAAPVTNGQVVYFRWILDGSTSSSGVGIDNFSIALITVSCVDPTTQAGSVTFPTVGQNNLTLNWTSGNGDSRAVYVNSTNSFTEPVDGAALPSVNTTWANSGQQLIYNGTGSSASVSGLQAGTTYHFRIYEYNCTGSNTHFLNSTSTFSQQTASPASTASIIQSQGGESATISSLVNGTIVSNSNGVQVWQFRLYDGNGSSDDADALPTIYTGWIIRPSASNTVPDWSTAIADRKFFLGSNTTPIAGGGLTNAASILFPVSSPFITVPDNGFVDIYMRITLANPLPVGSDGKRFGFSLVPADVTVASSATSSQLGTFTATSSAPMNVIDIAATLQFINAPTTVGLGDPFTITVSAIDANGNIDVDDNSLITLSQYSGTGTMSGGGPLNLINGTRIWSGLTYDVEETFQVRATGGGYAAITANINVVDADFQLFDDFNRSNSNTVGIPSSGGITAWTETESGDGTKIRIFSNQLMLDNCVSSDPSGSSGGTGSEFVSFNGENLFETVFNSANGTLNWLFNMRANNSDLSGFDGSNYGVAFVLGSDLANFTAAGADGYAVVVGNSGSTDNIRLVKFTNGLSANANLSTIAESNLDIDANHASVRVSFNPCNGQWSLRVRNDGSSFVAPNLDTPAFSSAVTATNTDHTSLDLKHFGALWKHNSSCTGNDAFFDNFYIPNASTAVANTKTWNGSVGTNWNTAANWGPCPGVPAITDNVVIPNVGNKPVVSGTPAAVCRSLTVNSGAELTINSGQNLTADNAVTNNGLIRVLNGGNFIQTANSTSHTGSGTMTVQRQGTASTTVYNYWSSPVVSGALPGGNRYQYNSSLGTHSNADDSPADPGWQAFSGTMTPGRGYASTGGGLTTFTGVPNNLSVPYAVTTSAQPMTSTVPGSRFNLVGNPFPSAISASSFLSVNGPAGMGGTGRVAGVLYFWDDDNSGGSGYSTSDYATWTTIGSAGGGGNTPNGSIASGQGFKVDAQSSGNITFTNAMRGGSNTQFFRLSEEEDPMDRLWLSMAGSGRSNQTLVAFRDDATDLRDVMYDAYKMRGNAHIALASVQAGETFAVAAYPTLTAERTVPLMTYVSQEDAYTFTADSVDGFDGYTVYLEDLQTGQLHELVQGAGVTLQVGPQDEYGRFRLRFAPELVTGLGEDGQHSGLRVLSGEHGLQVVTDGTGDVSGELRLHTLTGQLVLSRRLTVSGGRSAWVDVTGLPLGVYVAGFVTGTGTVNSKLLLR